MFQEFKQAPKWQQLFVAGVFALGAIALAGSLVQRTSNTPQAGSEAAQLVAQLSDMAGRLDAAESRGDRAAAATLADPITGILRTLSGRADVDQGALRDCRQAAAHLADGMAAVYRGGRWTSRGQYQAALAACK